MSDDHQPELKPGHNPYNKLAATLSKTGQLTPIGNLLHTAIEKKQASNAKGAVELLLG
ncbi:hypothetical protein PGT21_009049 [Puccinia graminis f. sp. tritici]|uniref:Uncharacterized protein n=1 Tax=Puccinia graminis f. sp. tritici TaxID=56615 RepID=A0A5B0Q2C3_PUCGR|nr:hypothetical protein PGT21_009049 [Puccinia graminis f. sp. tritici]KAA1124865.1 hypothetical protein PGTUg99_036124 [Puccinia graminis f. sp. tritici]